jgi:DNA-binding NtrC family response regulator
MRSKRQLHILFADADESIVQISTALLERLGHKVSGHNESLKALRAFSEEPDEFDLAIIDHDMPDVTGLELGERFRRIRPGFPVMLYSGYLDGSVRETIGAAGIEHVVIKPMTVEKLERVVRAAL